MPQRIDQLLVKKGFFESRAKAVMAIEAGSVQAGGKIVSKPSEKFDEDATILIVGQTLKYVSRGGLKLEKAICEFSLDFNGKTVLDMGSSTGGFTDCLLQNNAKKVYAVDIGSNQLAEKLKGDSRVVSMENTDVKNLDKKIFGECDFIVADISFVSIAKIMESIIDRVSSQKLMLLIKPQFECGVAYARKHKGIIRNEADSREIAQQTILKLQSLGLKLLGLSESPIKGGDGNTEYISLWQK